LPLWFGNQHAPGPQNPVYGTSRVVAALVELHEGEYPAATAMLQRASAWLIAAQNGDGGWGAEKNVASSIEETALAVDALARTIVRQATPVCASRLPDKGRDPRIEIDDIRESLTRGVNWLIDNTRRGEAFAPSPIGLYFASLWYSQSLYPIIFTVAALAQARKTL
jgi:squalene-hopene/tetraprenyl-beta-curcumene cyclase